MLTSVCSRRKFEPLMLNSLLSTWRKSSHEHWTIPEQRSPHLLYMYKTRAILAVWLYSDARNILTIDANFAQKQFSTRTATCGRDNRNVTVLLNTWKLKTLAFKNYNVLVASRLRISRPWRKFTIWRKLLFFGVLFVNFHIKDENTRGKQAGVTLSYSHRESEDSERAIYLL